MTSNITSEGSNIEKNIENKPLGARNTRSGHNIESRTQDSVSIPPHEDTCAEQKQNVTKHTSHNETVDQPEKWKQTSSSIRIRFAQRKEKKYVEEFLRNDLIMLLDDIDKTQCEESEVATSVIVYFSSAAKAGTALKVLQSGNKEYTVSHVVEAKPCSSLGIEALQTKLEKEHTSHLKEHSEKTRCLEKRLGQLNSKKKYLPLKEYERMSQERDILQLKINECQQQKKEFEDYVQLRLARLSSLPEASEVTVLKMELAREYTRFSKALPIYARRSEIVETVNNSHVTVLVGETGSGKSTQVVQYLYEAGIARDRLIVCTQPRKVAAITLARHVSREMQVELGKELGYRVGMSEKCSRKTKIFYMTDHMLLNECIADQTLSKYSCVVIDEAHERSINTDMLLAFLKQCLSSQMDLKVVIMSATIEPELFVRYFQGTEQERNTNVSTIMVSGRTFPVEVEYDPLHFKVPISSDTNYVMNAVDVVQKIHSNDPPGDILTFLTCAPEIERACRAMENLQRDFSLSMLANTKERRTQ